MNDLHLIFKQTAYNHRRAFICLFLLLLTGLILWVVQPARANIATTDIDLITNIESDKIVVNAQNTIVYTVTVENRGPATAINPTWQVGLTSANGITNTACVASNGATCPASFTTTLIGGVPTISSTILSLPIDGKVTLTVETTAWYLEGETKSTSTVTPNGQTDAVPDTNEADINISVVPALRSFGVTKSVVGFEDVGGSPVITATAGGFIVYEVVVTNDGIDAVYDLSVRDRIGVEAGTAGVPDIANVEDGTVEDLSGYDRDFFANNTTLASITCVGANGTICPADETFTEQSFIEYFDIPYMPGRTRAAAGDPGAYPSATATFTVKVQVGEISCSATGGHRTFLNEARVTTSGGNSETAGLGAPYGPGDSTDNLVEVELNVPVPVCDQFDVAVGLTEPTIQATNGIDANGVFTYTVTVSNSGPDPVTDLPFAFGTYYGPTTELIEWVNFWSLDSSVGCVAAGGAVCPASYTVNPHTSEVSWSVEYSDDLNLPDIMATIPSLPSAGSLTFTVTGTAGELPTCDRPKYIDAYAYAIPADFMRETNINIPEDGVEFDSYYNVSLNGFPISNASGSFYGNNGFKQITQWNTGIDCVVTNVDYDVSIQMEGPFATPTDTVPIAGPLSPGQQVYYRVQANNLDDGIDDAIDFVDPISANVDYPDAYVYLYVERSGFISRNPNWLDMYAPSGFGSAAPDYFHPLDSGPGTYPHYNLYPEQYPNDTYPDDSNVPWAAIEDIGIVCQNTTNGAECPDADEEVEFFMMNGIPIDGTSGNRHWITIANPGYGIQESTLALPVGSSMEFMLPYLVPPATVDCIPGGEIWTADPDTNGAPKARINSFVRDTNLIDYAERTLDNNEAHLSFQVQIPACVGALEIDKQISAPAAADTLPETGLVEYTIDLTYPATSTVALDVARFMDTPSVECDNDDFGQSCIDWELVNFVGCTVTAGNATCPTQLPIGQKLAQDGTLTPIDAGTIDTRWGTPNAADVAGGAAFEAGGSIRITLEAQASNEVDDVAQLFNRAVFASDPETSIFTATLFTEDNVVIAPPSPDSMVLRQSVSPSSAAQGDTITYTIEAINNGVADGQGATIVDELPTSLIVANPSGFTNLVCEPITETPPLLEGGAVADCNNVTITNNGTDGFEIEMTGSWSAFSGYRFIFNAIAPASGTSVENTATLTPPPATGVQRFTAGVQDSTTNFRTPDTVLIGDQVWIENDGNGNVADGYVGPVVNVVVSAESSDGTIYTATTDSNGIYTITVPASATYTVTVPTPAGYEPSGTLVTSSDDASMDDGRSHDGVNGTVVTVGTQDNLKIDFGFVPDDLDKESYIGDYVWVDADRDGLQDPGEDGIEGVVVGLYPPLTIPGVSPLVTTTTDANGIYTFTYSTDDFLLDTSYVIRVDTAQPALADYAPTTPDNTGDDTNDSDGVDSSLGGFETYIEVPLTSPSLGQNDVTYDFGFVLDVPADWGDLPNGSPVMFADDGPYHERPSGGSPTVWLGATAPDYDESDGQHDFDALGDDTNTSDDEDGFFEFEQIVPGGTMNTFIHVNGTDGTADVGYWIDWDANGYFTDTVDFFQFYNDYPTGSASYIQETVTVPASLDGSTPHPRVRIRAYPSDFATVGDTSNVLPTGGAENGEIEDHLMEYEPTAVRLARLDSQTQVGTLIVVTTALFGLLTLGITQRIWSRKQTICTP